MNGLLTHVVLMRIVCNDVFKSFSFIVGFPVYSMHWILVFALYLWSWRTLELVRTVLGRRGGIQCICKRQDPNVFTTHYYFIYTLFIHTCVYRSIYHNIIKHGLEPSVPTFAVCSKTSTTSPQYCRAFPKYIHSIYMYILLLFDPWLRPVVKHDWFDATLFLPMNVLK
jgi:hypothetical protein